MKYFLIINIYSLIKILTYKYQYHFFKLKNNKIKVDRFTFYNKVNHPNLVVKVSKKSKIVKGITLTGDQNIKTIDNLHINDSFKVLKHKLGCNFTERKVGKGYKLILYVDKTHRIKLSAVIKDEKIKKFEFYKQ